jgi:CheY-like chemotaxis protein
MATTTDPDTLIIVDDELHNMTWMIDYLNAKKLIVITASNVNDAVHILSEGIFRALIIDLNIPVLEPLNQAVSEKGNVYSTYPGLYVASVARNIGHRIKQVIIYSVHKDAAVAEEARKLGCTYIIKGRPKEIKAELDDVLSFDPTTATHS